MLKLSEPISLTVALHLSIDQVLNIFHNNNTSNWKHRSINVVPKNHVIQHKMIYHCLFSNDIIFYYNRNFSLNYYYYIEIPTHKNSQCHYKIIHQMGWYLCITLYYLLIKTLKTLHYLFSTEFRSNNGFFWRNLSKCSSTK